MASYLLRTGVVLVPGAEMAVPFGIDVIYPAQLIFFREATFLGRTERPLGGPNSVENQSIMASYQLQTRVILGSGPEMALPSGISAVPAW